MSDARNSLGNELLAYRLTAARAAYGRRHAEKRDVRGMFLRARPAAIHPLKERAPIDEQGEGTHLALFSQPGSTYKRRQRAN